MDSLRNYLDKQLTSTSAKALIDTIKLTMQANNQERVVMLV